MATDQFVAPAEINPTAVRMGKIAVALGVVGLVLYFSPYTLESLFMGFVAPLLIVMTVAAAIGLIGKTSLEMVTEAVNAGNIEQMQNWLRRQANA